MDCGRKGCSPQFFCTRARIQSVRKCFKAILRALECDDRESVVKNKEMARKALKMTKNGNNGLCHYFREEVLQGTIRTPKKNVWR